MRPKGPREEKVREEKVMMKWKTGKKRGKVGRRRRRSREKPVIVEAAAISFTLAVDRPTVIISVEAATAIASTIRAADRPFAKLIRISASRRPALVKEEEAEEYRQ